MHVRFQSWYISLLSSVKQQRKITKFYVFKLRITSLALSLYTSIFGCGCGFGFEQKFWRIDGFGEKRHGSADLHTPIHLPLHRNLFIPKVTT